MTLYLILRFRGYRPVKLLEERILKDGVVAQGDVLKVSGFVNHLIDVELMDECGKELYRLFGNEEIDKILTIEASGIGIACLAARHFGVPVLFAKKAKTSNISAGVYTAKVPSFTHGNVSDIVVSKDFLCRGDRVLIIDDFLANGCALMGLRELCHQAKAQVIGAGIIIEKEYQGGGNKLRAEGMRIESLAKIKAMSVEEGIEFC